MLMPVSVFSQTSNGLIVRNQTECRQCFQVLYSDAVCKCPTPEEPIEYLALTDIIYIEPGNVDFYPGPTIASARIPEVYPPGCNVGATVGYPCQFTGFLPSHIYIAKLTCGTPCNPNPNVANTTATWIYAGCGQPAELRFTSP